MNNIMFQGGIEGFPEPTGFPNLTQVNSSQKKTTRTNIAAAVNKIKLRNRSGCGASPKETAPIINPDPPQPDGGHLEGLQPADLPNEQGSAGHTAPNLEEGEIGEAAEHPGSSGQQMDCDSRAPSPGRLGRPYPELLSLSDSDSDIDMDVHMHTIDFISKKWKAVEKDASTEVYAEEPPLIEEKIVRRQHQPVIAAFAQKCQQRAKAVSKMLVQSTKQWKLTFSTRHSLLSMGVSDKDIIDRLSKALKSAIMPGHKRGKHGTPQWARTILNKASTTAAHMDGIFLMSAIIEGILDNLSVDPQYITPDEVNLRTVFSYPSEQLKVIYPKFQSYTVNNCT